RARGGEHRTGIVVFERSAKRAHQRRCAIERELRSLANKKRAKAACRPELGDILSQPAGRGDETCPLHRIELRRVRQPGSARDRVKMKDAPPLGRTGGHHRAGMHRRQPRPDPDDLAPRLVPGRIGKRAKRVRDAAAALERAAGTLAERDDPQPGACFCCIPAMRQTTPNSAYPSATLGATIQPSFAPWISPIHASPAPTNAVTAARFNCRSMMNTAIAPSTIPARTDPLPSVSSPWYTTPLLPSLSKPTFAAFVPAAPSAPSMLIFAHSATFGMIASTTAGAWLAGLAWNACAPITRPLYSRIGRIATSGMRLSSSAVRPRKHTSAITRPVASE